MLAELKFVKGAVAVKDYQPALTHFQLKDGRVLGYNGTIALSTPIGLDINATPKAIPFVKAIERCKAATTSVHLTPSGSLGIKSGGFKAFIECTDEDDVLDAIVPEGEPIDFDDSIIDAFSALRRFTATDASRPWANGILLRDQAAWATNNIIFAQYWLGYDTPEVCIPAVAIDELRRIKEYPSEVLMTDRSMTFMYDNGRWLRTQLLVIDWPRLDPIFNVFDTKNYQVLPEGFFELIELLRPFVGEEGRVFFRDGMICTSPFENQGASYRIAGLPSTGAFNIDQLLLLWNSITHIDFSQAAPRPCPWWNGEEMRGVILGMIDL